MGNCLYCGQTQKRNELFHKKCSEFYFEKIERALKYPTEAYPTINVRRNGKLKKINFCREDKFPISKEMIRKTKEYVTKKNIKGVFGLCLRCVQNHHKITKN